MFLSFSLLKGVCVDSQSPGCSCSFCTCHVLHFAGVLLFYELTATPPPAQETLCVSFLEPGASLGSTSSCFFTCQKHTGEPVPRASQSVGWLVGGSVVQDQPWNRLYTVQAEKPSRMMLFCADGFPAGWTERLFPTDLGAEEKTETTRRDLMMRC